MNGLHRLSEKPVLKDPRGVRNGYSLGWWNPDTAKPFTDEQAIKDAIFHINQPVYFVIKDNQYAAALGGYGIFGDDRRFDNGFPLAAYVPPCPMENLGDPAFCSDFSIRYPYISGSMANGISSIEMVVAMGYNGMLGFFGSSGMSVGQAENAIDRISEQLADIPYGFNLIHSPNEPELENRLVDLYLRRGIRLVEASAYMDLTLPVVRYRVHGIHRNNKGEIVTRNRIIAKVSRIEVASKFFAPAPDRLLRELVATGDITVEQAHLAAQVPMAQDITAEADSGGHTDNRPAISLLPTIMALRDRMQRQYGFEQRLRVGAAGGIATPTSAMAAFSMGAAYVMTGSVNQACIESGTCDEVREMLSQAQQADVTMAPAADMFEMGVTVQVLKRGTMFAMRSAKLYEIYLTYNSLSEIPPSVRAMLEKNIFRDSLESIWSQTRDYFLDRDVSQIERAERDPKHLMALIFRWYLGQSSRWANNGEESRKIDYQIWCGPAMGAFNEWAKGSFFEHPRNRKVADIALNLLLGAAIDMRINSLRCQGVFLSPDCIQVDPLEPAQVREYMS